MYTLPHTLMRVPTHDVGLIRVQTRGTGWSATLGYVLSSLGEVRNEHGTTRLTPSGHSARSLWAVFVSQCANAHGRALTEAEVLDHLHTEQAWDREVTRAEKKGAFAVRIELPDGTDRAYLPLFPDLAPPAYEEAAARIDWQNLSSEQTVSTSLWTGHDKGWVQHYRAPQHPSPEEMNRG